MPKNKKGNILIKISFQFAQSNLSIISGKSENLLFKSYYFCSDKRLAICAQFIQVHRKQEWAHFTNYVDRLTEVIKVDVHATDWKLGKCSCSFLKKNYICSHLVVRTTDQLCKSVYKNIFFCSYNCYN